MKAQAGKMIGGIEKRVKAGRNLRTMRVLLAVAARLVPPLPRFTKASALILEGRLLVEYHANRMGAAEDIFLSYARKRQCTFWAVSTYVSKVVEAGLARRSQEILAHPEVPAAVKALLGAALRRSTRGLLRSSEAQDPTQPGYHMRLAEDGLLFMDAEEERLDLSLALSTALSAEACDREDLFAKAIRHLIRQMEIIEKDVQRSRQMTADMVAAKLSIFDLDGAQEFLAHPFVAGTPKARRLLADTAPIFDDTSGFRPAMRKAHEDVLLRAVGRGQQISGLPVILMPAAAFRHNKIDYPGFRSDIRFTLASIVKTLDTHQTAYEVRSRLRTHGSIELSVPFFAYHTISSGDFGLHFKETDRPSLFSFDCRGYSGWSEFSGLKLDELRVTDVDRQEASIFFQQEKDRVIGGNLSKYRQAAVADVEELPEKFIFVALQLISDAVSQLAYLDLFTMLEEVVSVARKQGLPVVVKRHPLCTTPEVSRHLAELVSQQKIIQVHSSIHAVIPKALAVCVINSGVGAEALLHEKPVYVFGGADYMAGCFVCRKRGDFAEQFVPGEARLSPDELRKFWYLLRNRYAIDLRDRPRAAAEIEARVMQHLARHGH